MLGLRKCSDIECSVEIIFTYAHGPYTVMWVIFGGANFHEKPVMSLRINFRGLKCQSHASTWVEMFVGGNNVNRTLHMGGNVRGWKFL